jgi:thiol-disulfide isomerase/thioredoxin
MNQLRQQPFFHLPHGTYNQRALIAKWLPSPTPMCAPPNASGWTARETSPDRAPAAFPAFPASSLTSCIPVLNVIEAKPSTDHTMKPFLPSLLAALAFTASPAFAAELGQPAAPLKISEWIKGKPVDLAAAKGKQVVVVEFWATWCGPCRTSIPHLTKMQKKFKDVVFIGVSDEDAPTVKKFVNKLGEQMDYTVAIDDNRQTSKGYMEAFDQGGIPHAFIVDLEGRVVWHGHPMGGLEEAVAEVVAGKFDLNKAKKRAGAETLMREFYEAAGEGDDEAKITRLGKELEALDAEVGGLTPGRQFSAAEVRKSIKFRNLLRDYQTAIMANKSGPDLAAIEQSLTEYAPEGFNLAEVRESMQLNQLFNEYYLAASGRGGSEKLVGLAKKLSEVKTSNGRLLNEWAWMRPMPRTPACSILTRGPCSIPAKPPTASSGRRKPWRRLRTTRPRRSSSRR